MSKVPRTGDSWKTVEDGSRATTLHSTSSFCCLAPDVLGTSQRPSRSQQQLSSRYCLVSGMNAGNQQRSNSCGPWPPCGVNNCHCVGGATNSGRDDPSAAQCTAVLSHAPPPPGIASALFPDLISHAAATDSRDLHFGIPRIFCRSVEKATDLEKRKSITANLDQPPFALVRAGGRTNDGRRPLRRSDPPGNGPHEETCSTLPAILVPADSVNCPFETGPTEAHDL